MAILDKLLNGGAIIPIPEVVDESTTQRTSSALIWGQVVDDPRPFVENTKKRGQLLKIVFVIRINKKSFQRCHVPSDCPFYFTVRALKKGDRIVVFGTYAENDGFVKDPETKERVPKLDENGNQVVYRDFYPGFIVPEIAITEPEEWIKRMREVPDPFYEAGELLAEKEAKKAASSSEGPMYAADAYTIETRKVWQSG